MDHRAPETHGALPPLCQPSPALPSQHRLCCQLALLYQATAPCSPCPLGRSRVDKAGETKETPKLQAAREGAAPSPQTEPPHLGAKDQQPVAAPYDVTHVPASLRSPALPSPLLCSSLSAGLALLPLIHPPRRGKPSGSFPVGALLALSERRGPTWAAPACTAMLALTPAPMCSLLAA